MYKKLFVNKLKLTGKANKHSIVLVCFSLIFITNFSAYSQTGKYPVKRIRSFKQEEVSGVNTGRDRIREKKTNYLIYLELWAGKSLEITHLWFNNEPSGFQVEKTESPVFHPASKNAKMVIPKTSGDVLQLKKTELSEDEKSTLLEVPSAYRHYPILIRYQSDGKTFYLGAYPKQIEKQRRQ